VDFEAERAGLISSWRGQIKDPNVLKVMGLVPRERFIPPEAQHLAYEDIPLPIGQDQTISQPLMVAIMTEALKLKGDEKILEIGTGSGYQAAILAGLARLIITVERLPELAEKAVKVFKSLGYTNVITHIAGDTLGWPQDAPYDGIIVTAGAPRIPEVLIDQLAIGGRLVIPVGSRYEQDLYRITRHEKRNEIEDLGGCRFVPLIGKGAWENEY
jgi:protein-L-isoaspartate(D-aspartate) O-methyltransferase